MTKGLKMIMRFSPRGITMSQQNDPYHFIEIVVSLTAKLEGHPLDLDPKLRLGDFQRTLRRYISETRQGYN